MDFEDVQTIAVVGAGRRGRGTAEIAALAGYEVTLHDTDAERVEEGYDGIERSLDRLVDHEQLSREEAEAALDRMESVVDLPDAVEHADVVVDADPARSAGRSERFDAISAYAPEAAVFVTVCASRSVSELASLTDRPELFCGMHVVDPTLRSQVVEVVTAEATTDATVSLVEQLSEAFGKTPLRVPDAPGFVVNRIRAPLVNEAAWLVEEGVSRERVDASAVHGFGLHAGALELGDKMGLDVVHAVLSRLQEDLGAAYEPAPALVEKVEADELGRKVNVGFYDYASSEPSVLADQHDQTIERQLLAVVANETAKLVAADVADADTVDEALARGGQFPDGPATLADRVGLETLVETLEQRHEETGAARYEPAPALRDRAGDGGFHGTSDEATAVPTFDHVRLEYPRDDVAELIVDRPHELNAITPAVLSDIEAALDHVEDGDSRALVISGDGTSAFSGGTDAHAVDGTDPLDAVELSRTGQRILGRLERSSLPVVAAIEGYCLGGGMELAACTDLRVAGEGAEFGVPDLERGLMPGWGGSQRLPRIVGEGRAKELILTGRRYDTEEMATFGFVNDVVPEGEAKETARDLAATLADGPQVAQRFVKHAIHRGRDDTEAGLAVESQSFGHLVGTAEAEEHLKESHGVRDR